jgi:hypothetical protein
MLCPSKKMKTTLFSLLLCFWLCSCQSKNERIINKLTDKQHLFDEFVKAASKDEALLTKRGKFVRPKELNEATREKLERLGIPTVIYLVLKQDDCSQTRDFAIEILMEGNWTLEYKPCGNLPIFPGNYSEDGFIESWGINQNWYLWVNNDFIG